MKNNRILRYFSLVMLISYGQSTAFGSTESPTGQPANYIAPVTVQPAIPIENQDVELVIDGNKLGKQDTGPITFVIKDRTSGTIIAQKTETLTGEAPNLIRLKWKPVTNGWKSLLIVGKNENGNELFSHSLNVPVVAHSLSFAWYGGHLERDKSLKYANIVQVNSPDLEQMKKMTAYWELRGVRVCQFKGAPPNLTADEYVKYLAKGFDSNGTAVAESLWVDELGSYSDKELYLPNLYEGLKTFTEKYPNTWTGVWIAGALQPSYCNIVKNTYRKTGVDLLLLEAYVNYKASDLKSYKPYAFIDQYINTARFQDVLQNSIITLAINDIKESGYITSPGSIEDQIRYIRSNAPEIRGVGFFKSEEKEEIVRASDEFCRKYWIDPVLATWDSDILFSNYSPEEGEDVKISASIFNIGGMDARDVEVSFYDNDPRYGGKQIGNSHSIPVITPKQGCPAGRVDLTQTWKAARGLHELFVVIKSKKPENTILDPVAKKMISVR